MTASSTSSRQTYVLRYNRQENAAPEESSEERFVIYKASDKQQCLSFDNIEQVMNYLLDELFQIRQEEAGT